jgi:hypothetical protein
VRNNFPNIAVKQPESADADQQKQHSLEQFEDRNRQKGGRALAVGRSHGSRLLTSRVGFDTLVDLRGRILWNGAAAQGGFE